MASLASEFTAVLSLQALIDRVLESLHRDAGFDSGLVALLDAHNPDVLAVVGASGIRTHLRGLAIPRGRSLHWTVMDTGTPLRVPDMQTDPRSFRRDDHVRSAIYAPLIVHDRPIGILSAYRGEVDAFTPSDLDLLTVVARYLAGAFEVARLYEEADHKNAYLSALQETALGLMSRLNLEELLETIVRRAGQLVGTSHGHFYLVNPGQDEIEVKVAIGASAASHFIGYRLKPGEGVGGRVWQTGEPVVVDDYEVWPHRSPRFPPALFHAVVGMPLKSGTRVEGVMVLAYAERARTFGREEIDVLSRFAELASIALDNARLYTERMQAEQLLRDRNRTLEMFTKGEPLPEILTQIARLTEVQAPGAICSFLLVREGRLYHGATLNMPEAYVRAIDGMTIGPTAASFGAACHRGEPVITDDIASDPLWEEYRELGLSHGFRACWSAPIFSSEGQVLGVVAMYYREPRHPGTADLELLETARHMAAVAIEQRRLAEQLAHQAHHDALTGLPNRVLYEDRLQQALARARRDGRPVALCLIDLDRFKRVNDTLGHHVGDLLLAQVAQRLQTCVRQSDTLARWGGDEFTVVLTDLKTPDDAVHIAEKILDAIRAPLCVERHELCVTGSIGISLYPIDGRDSDDLLRHADSAMYRAKGQGRNTYEFFTPQVGVAVSERLRIEVQLRQALERHELELYYQPQVELKSGRLVGVEALPRWNHPERGVLPTASFISIAEESGLVVPIGAWVLQDACRQLRTWQRSGYFPSLTVAINVSTMQFGRADLVDQVVQVLEQTGLAAGCLELELAESLIMRDVDASTRQLDRLRGLGVTIAIDDFGVGYSPLGYLQRFSIDTLKIAQPHIHGIGETQGTRALIRAIVALAHTLGLRVTAQGVETSEQHRFLRRFGCDRAQGYLLGRPTPASEFEAFLQRSRTSSRRAKGIV